MPRDTGRTSGLDRPERVGLSGVPESRVSRIERGDDLYLSTLERCCHALGGTLELRVLFDDDEVSLRRPALEAVPSGHATD